MEAWIYKYRPKKLSEVIGQDSVLQRMKSYVEGYKKGQKVLFVYGPQGVGKTASVYALAEELGFDVLEINASDVRNAEGIKTALGPALNQMSLFATGRIILIDEVDGVSGRYDRGGVPAIADCMVKSSFPVVLIANDPWEKKFNPLRKKSEMLEFNQLSYLDIKENLKRICKQEDVEYEDDALQTLARSAGGDMRAAINDLQTASAHSKIKKEFISAGSQRDQTETIMQALVRVFKTLNIDIARSAYNDVNEDLDKIFLWMEHNLPYEYTKPKDLMRAFDALSLADVYYGRIRRWQYYRFYVYCYDLLSAGIALAKDEKYHTMANYQQTKRLLKIWMANSKAMKKKAIVQKIAENTHTSAKRVSEDVLPYFRMMFKRNSQIAGALAEEFELGVDEVAWLRK